MKRIRLTQGKFSLVDDEDFYKFGCFKWSAWWSENTGSFYAHRALPTGGKRGIRTGKGRLPTKIVSLHREIMGIYDPRILVDHKNHDTLDNRRLNLRVCNYSQNAMNLSGNRKNSTSGIRGVCWRKDILKWHAKIGIDSKRIHLGFFEDKTDAANAYASANLKYFGEFGGKL